MSLTFSAFGVTNSGPGSTVVTVTIPANSSVGVLVGMGGPYTLGVHAGSVTDSSGSNTYTPAGGLELDGSVGMYTDSFYSLNTGSSATTLTYVSNAAYSGMFYITVCVWVWTVSGGIAVFGSQSSNGQSSPGTGTNAITSGAVTCSAGSVIMGLNTEPSGTGTVTHGTGFTANATANNDFLGEYGAFSASQGATFTDSNGALAVISQAISFGLSVSGVPVAWWV
jgi:hypothetical protein